MQMIVADQQVLQELRRGLHRSSHITHFPTHHTSHAITKAKHYGSAAATHYQKHKDIYGALGNIGLGLYNQHEQNAGRATFNPFGNGGEVGEGGEDEEGGDAPESGIGADCFPFCNVMLL